MKRPMIFCGTAALLLSVLMIYTSSMFIYCAVAVLVGAVTVFFAFRRHYLVLPLVLIVLLITLRCLSTVAVIKTAKSLPTDMTVTGIVTDVAYNENSVSYTVKTDKTKIRLISVRGINAKQGDKISAESRVVSAGQYGDLARGAHATAFLYKLKSLNKTNSLHSHLYNLRKGVQNLIYDCGGGDESAMLIGLTLGENGYISDSLSDNIRRSGVSHMIVVSGLHLGIIVGTFLKIAHRIKINRFLTGAIGIIMVLFIIGITGFTVSVLRSALAYFILLFGYLLGRKPDALNSLFAAVLILCLINPLVVINVSFQLSASATFGVLILGPAVDSVIMMHKGDKWYDKIAGVVSGVVSTSLSATLTTLPFTIWHFGTLSTVAILTNMLTNHSVTVALVLAVLGIAFCFIKPVSTVFLLLSRVAVGIQIYFINSLGSLPFSEYRANSQKTLAAILFCLVAGFTYLIKKSQKGVTKNGSSF